MSTVRKVAKNTLFFLTGNIIERIIGFFITLILIRYLGSGNFGKYSLVYAFPALFQFFTIMGIDPIVLRELSQDSKKGAELIGNAIILKILFSLIGLFLCWTILQWMNYPPDIKILIYLVSLSMVFSSGMLLTNIFYAQLLIKYPIMIAIAMRVLHAMFVFILIFLKATLFYFILINLLIYILHVFFIYYQSKKILYFQVAINLKMWKELLKNSLPLAISSIFISIYVRIDQVMLFRMKGQEEVGLYAAAVKIAELPAVLAVFFLVSVVPLLSKYAKTSPDLFKKTYQMVFKYLMIIIMPVAILTMLYSKQIILICYGRDFFPSQVALAILIWSTVFIYAGILHNNLLVATNLQHLDIIFTGSSAILNIFLNLILIPKYSFNGAAIATVVSYGLGAPLSYLFKKTRPFAKAMIKAMIKPFLAAILAGYLTYLFLPLNSIFKLVISIVIYLFLLLLLREIDSQDLRYCKEILTVATD